MLMDYEQELTTADGQAITATAYGTKPYDQKGAADAAVGEPLHVLMQVLGANFNSLTSLLVEVYGDDDGAGTNEVSLVSKSFTLAQLTTALGVRRVGIVPPGTRKKFLRAKFTVTGTNPSTGKIAVWLAKGADAVQAGVTI
jgi:hypothetical protein